MDYKEKYEAALERAREWYNKTEPDSYTCIVESIFPELKESNDEKIRKELINFVENWKLSTPNFPYSPIYTSDEEECDKILAWLEKQGERNSTTPQWMIDFLYEYQPNIGCALPHDTRKDAEGKMLAIREWLEKQKQEGDKDIRRKYLEELLRADDIYQMSMNDEMVAEAKSKATNAISKMCIGELLGFGEKQGEKVNEIKPIFKVGDTLKKKGKCYTFIVDRIQGGYYHCDHNYGAFFPIEEQDNWELCKEAKYNVGDWLVENQPNNYARFVQILDIVDVQGKKRYRISRDIHNDEDVVDFDFVEKYYHPFNIQDAKDGDALYSREHNLLFLYYTKEQCHIAINLYYDNNISIGSDIVIPEDTCPATKEQRELLFSKMKEAGYEFDFNKKELKKIEKPAEQSEDRNKELSLSLQIQAYLNTASDELYGEGKPLHTEAHLKGIHKCMEMWAKLHESYFNNEQNPSWSEEDRDLLYNTLSNLTELKDRFGEGYGKVGECIAWLKALKGRVNPQPKQEWKPNEEQIEAINLVLTNEAMDDNIKHILCGLKEQYCYILLKI